MAAIFSTISTLCTLLPARTPRQLIAVSSASTPAATAPSAIGSRVSSRK